MSAHQVHNEREEKWKGSHLVGRYEAIRPLPATFAVTEQE